MADVDDWLQKIAFVGIRVQLGENLICSKGIKLDHEYAETKMKVTKENESSRKMKATSKTTKQRRKQNIARHFI